MDGYLAALESRPCAIPPLNGPANTKDLAWPHKISDFRGGLRRDQNFSGQRLSPNFDLSRLPETKYRKSCVEQAALTRPVRAKSLLSEIPGTAWWRTQSESNLSPLPNSLLTGKITGN